VSCRDFCGGVKGFKLGGAEVVEARVSTTRVVKPFDPIERG
jgi:hypothetical protein